jgi:hypothetical protein
MKAINDRSDIEMIEVSSSSETFVTGWDYQCWRNDEFQTLCTWLFYQQLQPA